MTIKASYITRQITNSSRYLVIEIDDEGYESVIAEAATAKYATLIADCLNQATLEG